MKPRKPPNPRQGTLNFDRARGGDLNHGHDPKLQIKLDAALKSLPERESKTEASGVEPIPPMPVRRLHNYVYCPRLFYYQWVEGIFEENADTVAGSAAHERVDRPSRIPEDVNLDLPEGRSLRSLKIESEALGLVGVVDLIEGGETGAEIVEYKKGSAGRLANGERVAKESDAVQVAAQALLLREKGVATAAGWVYYAEERRRVPVELTPELFEETKRFLSEARALAQCRVCPPPLRDDVRCLYCSAYPVCLPNESAWWQRREGEAPDLKRAPRPDGDSGEILVVQKPGAHIGQRGDQFVVSVKGEADQKLPVRQVRSIYLYGAVQMTAQAAQACLELEIDVAYFSPAGRFLGLLRGLPASGIDARMGQYRLFGQEGMRVKLSRAIVRAKIHNQRVMLMRNGDAAAAQIDLLAQLRDRTDSAESLTELLGLEGAAASVYFEGFPGMLKDAAAWAFDFNGRNRRPPRDPVNAMLSMGYSVLAKELAGVCHAVGLDPFLGFYHEPRYGRPALALDLMEEFRPLIVDSVVISLVNRGEVGAKDFIRSASGTAMSESGRRQFWEAYFRRMDTEVTHPEFGYRMSYRRMLEVQARQMWRFLRGEASSYVGLTTR